MKKTFQEYYSLSPEEEGELWKEAIFVFDANVLLNLYQYSEKTRKEFLGILDKISNRIWLPYQFALEYQKKRSIVIERQFDFYAHVSNKLHKGFEDTSKEIKEYQNQHPFLKIDRLLSKIEKIVKEVNKAVGICKRKHPKWLEHDPIRDKLDQLFQGKVGVQCANIEEIERVGNMRISKKIPPGHEDVKKDYPYGDWIGWYQIMEMIKGLNEKKPVILITNDCKKDWWLMHKDKKTIIGPRPELINEISTYAVKFPMYTMERFLYIAKRIYKVQ